MNNDNNSPPPPYSEQHQEKSSHITIADSFPPAPHFQPQLQNMGPSAPIASPTHQPPNPHVHANTGSFGPLPVEMDCPYCHASSVLMIECSGGKHIVTHTRSVAGTLPWLIMAICFVLGFFLIIPWCICCIGFCIESCLDILHDCPSCKRTVGRFSRLG